MIRQPSHGSSSNNSTSSATPKIKSFWPRKIGRLSMGLSSPSQDGLSGLAPDKIFVRNHSEDPIVSSPLALPELEPTRSHGLPSPDPYFASTHDSEYMHLREHIRKLRKAPPGTEPKKVDAQWEVYKKLRDECLQLCKSLLEKSHSNGRNTSLESSLDPTDTRSSYSGSLMENPNNLHPNDQRIAAIQEYKAIQEQMLDNFRNSLLATYTKNEPDPSERQKYAFLDDVTFRKGLIVKWRDNSIHAMKSEKLLFWEQFKIRSLNFERLKLDLKAISQVIDTPEPSFDNHVADPNIQEHVIAKNGDAILEFGNKGREGYPMLRFRVSSHLLAESSPLFAQMLLPQQPGTIPPADMENQLPEPPGRHVCKDAMEVKVYRMPQIELNCHDALGILLHAAHMHNTKVPRQIEFPVFVSIAETCLRYRCTSPLELQVEYQWLPQWIHMANDESPDGLLLIGFAFGLRKIFTQMSKTAILNAVDEDEIQSKEIWPQAIKDKIKAIRAAKLAQIHECCTKAIEEYFRPPSTTIDRRTSVGSLELTTSPRCPKGQHLCDATNLGWLMLVYNELRVLPSLMNKVGFQNLPKSPRRSLKGLLDCLRLMPSAPQVHEGVCDYAPAFRSTIDRIYNSISGLTLKDITGQDGWALSKHAGPDQQPEDKLQEIIELPGSISERRTSGPATSARGFNNQSISNEEISLLSQSLEDSESDDIVEERRPTPEPHGSSYFAGLGNDTRTPPKISIPTDKEEKALAAEKPTLRSAPPDDEPEDDIYTASPLAGTIGHRLVEGQMSDEEAHRILWPDEEYMSPILSSPTRLVGRAPPEENEKVLLDDIQRAGGKPRFGTGDPLDAPLEGKTRIGDLVEEKNLRVEKDLAMGLGLYKQYPPLP